MSNYVEAVVNAQTGEVTHRPMTEAEIAALQPTAEQLAADARADRNRLLAESDWTQISDVPVDQAAWAIYRQALRDITDQIGFPTTIVWPTKPE